MMERFMMMLLKMSMQAAVVICVVLLVRLLLIKLRISKKYVSLLWLLPYLCLLLPWRMESTFSIWSVFPEVINEDGTDGNEVAGFLYDGAVQWKSGMDLLPVVTGSNDAVINGVGAFENAAAGDDIGTGLNGSLRDVSADAVNGYLRVAFCIWLCGVAVLLAYSVISYVRLRRKVLCSICLRDNIYFTDDISVPFVLGVIHPHIYLPSGMEQESIPYVLEHEKTHILRRDLWKKAAALFLTVLHWFNPFAWIAFYFMGKDIEMACDEETVQRIGVEKRQDYATVLLQVASGKSIFHTMTVPLAFGEGDTRGRIQNILKYRKTVGVVAGAVVILILILGVVFLSEPADSPESTEVGRIEITAPVISQATISGADGPILDYASDDMVIFHDYYGLFVYHLERGMIGAVDLSAIGCQYTQGEEACQVMVEQDGSKVYMHPMNAEEMYVYDVEQTLLSKQKDETGNMGGFSEIKDINSCIDPDYTVLRSGQCAVLSNSYHYLESGSGMPIDLAWVVRTTTENGGEQTRHIKLFTGEIQYYDNDNTEEKSDSINDIAEDVTFLEKEYDISQYLTLELPEGLKLGSYQIGMNSIWDGCIFEGAIEPPIHGAHCQESWYAPGGVGVLERSEEPIPMLEDIVFFEDGRFSEVYWYLNSSGMESEGEYVDGCERQALLYECYFQLFSPPEIEEYMAKYGVKEEEVPVLSRYWYVFFAEPDSEILYTVFLNREYFTKEDVIALAQSVRFVK